MTDAMLMKAPTDKRMTVKAEPTAKSTPNIAKHNWMSMDPDGPNPPPKDGKYIYVTRDGGQLADAVEVWWRNTRFYDRNLNGGRGGWGHTGFWCIRYQGTQQINFEPVGWAPTKS